MGSSKLLKKWQNTKHLATPSGNSAQTKKSLFGPFAEIEIYSSHKGPTHILAQ